MQVCTYYTAIVSLFTLFGVLIIPDVVRCAVVTLWSRCGHAVGMRSIPCRGRSL